MLDVGPFLGAPPTPTATEAATETSPHQLVQWFAACGGTHAETRAAKRLRRRLGPQRLRPLQEAVMELAAVHASRGVWALGVREMRRNECCWVALTECQ